MDFDINNQQALVAGAFYAQQAKRTEDWRGMATAPRDGTIIEVRCTYGVAPWYGLYRWTDRITLNQNGVIHEMTGQPRWAKVGDDSSGFSEDSSFSWRPYNGAATAYIDPTGGLQDSPAYWRGAVAAKYGLPLNYFEQETAQNVAKDQKKNRGFFGWLFGYD